jgi:hypothetical protein
MIYDACILAVWIKKKVKRITITDSKSEKQHTLFLEEKKQINPRF